MAASSIALFDALGTPVSHTFVPIGPDVNRTFWFEDQSQAAAVGFWRLSMSLKRPPTATAGQSSAQRVYRAILGLHEPVLEVLSGTSGGITPAPTPAYIPRMFCEAILPERSSLQNRKDLRKMMANALLEAQGIALFETLVTPY